MSSQEFGVGTKISNIQRPSCTPRWHCVRWLRLSRSIHRARFICVTNDGCKSNGGHSKAARMRGTSSSCSISLHPDQNGRWTIVIENSKVRMSRCLDTSTETQNGPNHGPAWKTQSSFLSEVCTVILWQDCCGKGNSRKLCWNTVGKKFWNGNAYLWTEKKDYSCLCMWTKKKLVGKKQNIDLMWKVLTKEVDLGEPTSFFDTFIWVALKKRMRNEQRYCSQLQKYDWIQDLCRSQRKATLFRFPWRRHLFMVLWCGRWCKEMCGAMLRAGEQNNPATVQSLWQTLGSFAFFHHTIEFVQYCHVGNTAQQCRLGLFPDPDFAGDLEDSISTSGGILCIFGSHTFVPLGWMCKKHLCFAQFNGLWDYLSWCRSTHGWNSSSWSLGFGYWSVAFFFQPAW